MMEAGGDDAGEPGQCCSAKAGDGEEKAELGVSAEEIADLESDGVIGRAPTMYSAT